MQNPLTPTLTRFAPYAYTILRVAVGVMFMLHGIAKLFGVLGTPKMPLDSQLGVGAVIELVTGGLIAIGFLTRIAALLASGQMAVAYLQFHWKFATDSQFFPSVNKGELALVYSFLFLVMACYGGGKGSVDEAIDASARGRVARLP